MARPLKPLVRGGGYYPSARWTPLVYPGGYTTANGSGVEPEPVEKTVSGAIVHITDALAAPLKALSVNVEPIQAGSGDPSPDNVRPISGRTSATVTRTGKNLFDPNTPGREHSAANNTISTGANYRSVRVPAISGTTYVFSATRITGATGAIAIAGLDEAGAVVQRQGTTTLSSVNITATNNVVEILASINVNTAFTDLQLEYGVPAATAYEPYQGNTYTIQLGDTVYGGTLDVTGGKMVVDRALYTFSESDVWTKYATGGKTTFNGASRFPVGINKNGEGMMSNYPFVKADFITNQPDKSFCFFSSPKLSICDNSYADATAADFASSMIGQQLIYPLATPFEITLTPTQIETLLGENNIWSDAGDVTVTYLSEGAAW